MSRLETRIPPPVVGLLLAAAMLGVARFPPALPVGDALRVSLAAALGFAGIAFDIAGVVAFRRARTTVNPLRPEQASTFVTTGVYRITRNPMYVGMALLLLGWACWLGAAWPFLGPALFVAWITRFQILPEERVLRARFDTFSDYASRVRRWL